MSKDDFGRSGNRTSFPNNAALVVAGDISMADLRSLVDKAFGGCAEGNARAAGARGPRVTTQAR
jgi:predicted Zn-dependent peptidase